MFTRTLVPVAEDPRVELFTAQADGPDDRALLVIHGGPDWDHSYLRDPLCRLAGAHRVIMADIRGRGRSTSGLAPGEYTLDHAVRDFVALLDTLGLPSVDVLGFSYGGLIAQRLTLTHPERVRRLVIASSSVFPCRMTPSTPVDDRVARDDRPRPGTDRLCEGGGQVVPLDAFHSVLTSSRGRPRERILSRLALGWGRTVLACCHRLADDAVG